MAHQPGLDDELVLIDQSQLRELVTLHWHSSRPAASGAAARTELVRGDMCDCPGLVSGERGMPCCSAQVSGRAHCMAALCRSRRTRRLGARYGRTLVRPVLDVPCRSAVHDGCMESTRVDRWLWAVRLTKTRPDAAAACRGGHVRVNDRPAKPATSVSPGDEVCARVGDTTRIVEVVRVIQKRVGAADAATCYLDRSPAPPAVSRVVVAARDRGAGRPTKRDRRILDRWRAIHR
jgi:ribosome-associated heat shock protein Hsp15